MLGGDLHGLWTCGLIAGGLAPTALAAAAAADVGVALEFATGTWQHTLTIATVIFCASAAHMFCGVHPTVGLGLALGPGLAAAYLAGCAQRRVAPRFLTARSYAFLAASVALAAYLPEVGLAGLAGGAVGGLLAGLLAGPVLRAATAAVSFVVRLALAAVFLVFRLARIVGELAVGLVTVTLRTAGDVALSLRRPQ